MAATVGIFEKALARLGGELDGLGLDVAFRPFDREGRFLIDGQAIEAGAVSLDYLWLSPDISVERIQGPVFEMVLNCRSIGVLQTFNAGLDHPVYGQVARRGTRICNSSAQAVAISEFVLAHALAAFHPMVERRDLQARKEWKITPFREISRTNWMIVGFGPIGQRVAGLAKAFGATTTVIRRSPATSETVDRSGTLDDLAQFLPSSDVVVLACPLNGATRGLANAEFFGSLKDGAVLINIARGALIDDAALITALDSAKLGHAVLDVFHEEPLPTDNPLWSHPGVTLTAHTSFSGSGTRRRWDELFLDNIVRFANGEQLANEVNPGDLV